MKAYVVEKEALSHNIELLQKMANGVPIWAVLKGNGYGIGALPLARHLAEAGIDHFCVTEVREAELLRENGFEDASILMLRSTGDPAELNRLMDLRVILTIGSWETACAINAIAAERADVVEAHLKIDTGMGRYGFLPEDMDHILGVYREQKNIAVSGVYTHFNCAFGSKKLTHQEFETFRKTVSAIREAGFAAVINGVAGIDGHFRVEGRDAFGQGGRAHARNGKGQSGAQHAPQQGMMLFHDSSPFLCNGSFFTKLPANRACGPVRRARRASAVASLYTSRHWPRGVTLNEKRVSAR